MMKSQFCDESMETLEAGIVQENPDNGNIKPKNVKKLEGFHKNVR